MIPLYNKEYKHLIYNKNAFTMVKAFLFEVSLPFPKGTTVGHNYTS